MGDLIHMVPAKKATNGHTHCPHCGTCVPVNFDIVMVKTDETAIANVRGVSFSCPGCGTVMVAETNGARARRAP